MPLKVEIGYYLVWFAGLKMKMPGTVIVLAYTYNKIWLPIKLKNSLDNIGYVSSNKLGQFLFHFIP